MHSLYKSVDKTPGLIWSNMFIIPRIKNLANPIRYVLIEYHKLSNGASKKINVSYYTIISTGVNKKLDPEINVCYNSKNQENHFYKL